MKIHIIGPSGSGKSYLARKLSHQFSIQAWSLDDLFWDNNGYSGKTVNLTRKRDIDPFCRKLKEG